MQVDWEQKWLTFHGQKGTVTLHGEMPEECAFTVIAIYSTETIVHRPEIQALLDKYKEVFSEPTGLPPRRKYDHRIPLIPGARPVSIRPYRIPPHLKTEMKKQVVELLQKGMIRPSNSPFSSPALM